MTKIEWTDKTWNPITGCTKISEGCKHCYAERMSHRLKGRFGYPEDEPFAVTIHEDKLDAPLSWKKPRKVFVCSMGDLFHEDVGYNVHQNIWDTMEATPQHTYIILTKRADNMLATLDSLVVSHGVLPNVWGLVTAENQKQADLRIPLLLQCQFAVRGVSIEPMLGAVDLSCLEQPSGDQIMGLYGWHEAGTMKRVYGLDWVICGGETGPGARTMDPNWARGMRDQCKDANVPFFFKKMGQGQPTPADLMIREWPTQK